MRKPRRPEWVARAQCEGKNKFDSPERAFEVAKQASRRKESKVSAYRCATCGKWHIGNNRQMKVNKHRS